jgi:anti-sigma factor RsiW
MSDCEQIDLLVTPYVDGDIAPADRALVDEHLRRCSPCFTRVRAERAVQEMMSARRPSLFGEAAPARLHARCRALAAGAAPPGAAPWRTRIMPFAVAAGLTLAVSGAVLYELTARSTRVMAAELTADHVKCFRVINTVLGTHDDAARVEREMRATFDWQMHLPEHPERAELELVGARPCLYPEGVVAHIMYRHRGHPVSLFMLPNRARDEEVMNVMNHQAAMWTVRGRTFVLITSEAQDDADHVAAFMHAALR